MSLRLVVPLALLAFLAACSSPKKADEAPAEPVAQSETESAVAQPDATDDAVSAGIVGDSSNNPVGLPPELVDRLVIYFPFDSDTISTADIDLLAQHARFLNGKSGVSLRLEGHTDERGTREYNIGLGERRAQAVRRALALQGVAESRLTTVSYGEERPAMGGEGEETFAKNRRVELVYGVN
ncbi:MAG: peptidoglycan-associated lipoprotein Pal [Steroidobacteraceae bacterium]